MERPDLFRPLAAMLAQERAPWTAFQQPGDVILTSSRGLLDLANRLVQTLHECRPAQATHAMVVASPGVYLDATPRLGVSLIPAELYSFEPTDRSGHLRRRLVAVYRHPQLAGSPAMREDLQRAMLAFHGQPYNFGFFLKRRPVVDRSSFCCELVVKVFRALGLELVPGRRSSAVLPDTLRRVLPTGGWLEVSDAYRSGLTAEPAA